MLESIDEIRRKRRKEIETDAVDGSSWGREAVAGWAKYGHSMGMSEHRGI